MTINPVNNDPSYIKLVQYGSGTNNISKISDSSYKQDLKFFQKSSSLDEKNNIVSEKIDQNNSFTSYNLRLQQFTPASQIMETITPYNDVQKFSGYKTKADNIYNSAKRKKTIYEEYSQDSSYENGFYMVINDNGTNQSLKELQDNISSWRDKINKKYNSGFFKETGTLINSLA
jgi:hypothetical protein